MYMKYTLTASLILVSLAGFSCKGGSSAPPTLSKQDSVEIMMVWTEVSQAKAQYQAAVEKWQQVSLKCGMTNQIHLDAATHDITCVVRPTPAASAGAAPQTPASPVVAATPADNSLGKKSPVAVAGVKAK